jgi:hypothetical protein
MSTIPFVTRPGRRIVRSLDPSLDRAVQEERAVEQNRGGLVTYVATYVLATVIAPAAAVLALATLLD